jgi:tetratricopeptide (TPR) repeat protein
MKELNQSDPQYIDAMTLYMSGKWKEAEVAFTKLHQEYPENTFLVLNLAQIYYSLGRLDDAIELNLQALEMNPNLGIAYYRLGVCYFRAGRLVRALDAFNKVVESSSQSHAMARYFVGLINFFLGNDENSEKAFAEFRGISKESMIANFFLAQLKLKHNSHQEALDLLTELVQETPKFSEVHYMMGQAYYGLHDNQDAIKCFQKVLEINPKDKRAKTKLTLMTDIDW